MLQESQRQQLDGIVQQATQNGETPGYIQSMVDDYKSKNDQPSTGFLQSLAQGVADPILQGARFPLGMLQMGVGKLTGSQKDVQRGADLAGNMPVDFGFMGKVNAAGYDANGKPLGFGRSLGQAAGAGLQIAPYAIGAGEAADVANAGVNTLGHFAMQGALKGTEAGLAQGAGSTLQSQSESGNYDPSAIASNALQAGAYGAAGGAVIEPIAAKFGGKIGIPLESPKANDAAWEAIKPKLSPTDNAAAARAGKLTTEGSKGIVTQVPKGNDLAMIDAAKPYVVNAKDGFEAAANLKEGIATEAKAARKGLESSGAIWNQNELKGHIGQIELPISVKSDATLSNVFENTKSAVLKLAEDARKTPDGILDLRQQLDHLMEDNFGNRIWDKQDGVSKVYKSFRDMLNDFADSKVPNGALKASLEKQSLLYQALDNVSEKLPKEGTPTKGIGVFFSKHPVLTKVAETAIGSGAVLGGAKALGWLGGGNAASTPQTSP